MECRIGCAACCIAPSISCSIPGMEQGKAAGVRCIQLSPDNKCKLFGKKDRPDVCINFKADKEICGQTNEDAYLILEDLEQTSKKWV